MTSGDKRDDGTTRTLMILMGGCAVASVLIGLYYLHADSAPVPASSSGFDIAQVDARPPVSAPRARPSGPQTSPLPVFGSLAEELQAGPSAQSSGAAAARPAGAAPAVPSDYDRAKEAAFLAAHRSELERYERKLARITDRYYKNSPVVRQVDADFARMDRYMAVKHRYDQNGDPFQFVRDAIALPEVRSEIAAKVADPAAWSAAIGMVNEALKDPPPPAVYQAAQQFMTGDPDMSAYVKDFTKVVNQNMGVAAMAIPAGTDMSGMTKLARDVAPGAVAPQQ